jgi:hypothetical protein
MPLLAWIGAPSRSQPCTTTGGIFSTSTLGESNRPQRNTMRNVLPTIAINRQKDPEVKLLAAKSASQS